MNITAFLTNPQGVKTFQVPLTSEQSDKIESPLTFGAALDYTRQGDADEMPALGYPFVLEPKAKFIWRQTQPENQSFIWSTADGDNFYVHSMATEHLFHALRMLFNHTVPPAFRVGKFIRRAGVSRWPATYREQAMRKIAEEIAQRNDRDIWIEDELDDMLLNARAIVALGL